MWLELQRQGGPSDEIHEKWERAWRDYSRQLETLREKVSEDTYSFFDAADVHDGELLELRLTDASRSDPLWDHSSPWQMVTFPVNAELAVLDAADQFVWHVSYAKMKRIAIDYPGGQTLFYQTGEGFGDWGYHELTDAGDGFLRHEILFATGSAIVFEFKEIAVKKTPAHSRPATGG